MLRGRKPESAERPRSIAWDSLVYMAGQTGVLLFGLLTFPLFTRLLPRRDYGLLALTNNTLTLLGLLVGLGLPNAVLRFLPEYIKAGDEARRIRFNTTHLAFAVLLGSAGSVVMLAVSLAAPGHWRYSELLRGFRWVTALLVSRAAANILQEFFRVARQTAAYNTLALSQKAANATFAVAGFLSFRSLEGLLAGMTIGEVLAVLIGLAWAGRRGHWKTVSPDSSILHASLTFSIPVMMVSVCASLMAYADRYLLLAYAGEEGLATYAVAYDLCLQLQVLLVTSFRLSAMPEIVTRYTSHGAAAAADFIAAAFRSFSWLLIGAGFGLVAVREEVIQLLASSRYAEAAGLLPWLVPAVLLGGMNFILSVNLHLKKRTDLGFAVSAACTALSLALYFWLVPRYRAQGAAIAHLITYVTQCCATRVVANRLLAVRFDLASLARTTFCGALMFVLVRQIGDGMSTVAALALKVGCGMLIYAIALCLAEPQARRIIGNGLGIRQVAR